MVEDPTTEIRLRQLSYLLYQTESSKHCAGDYARCAGSCAACDTSQSLKLRCRIPADQPHSVKSRVLELHGTRALIMIHVAQCMGPQTGSEFKEKKACLRNGYHWSRLMISRPVIERKKLFPEAQTIRSRTSCKDGAITSILHSVRSTGHTLVKPVRDICLTSAVETDGQVRFRYIQRTPQATFPSPP